ncbi:MAG TPA: 2OG-Fe(II) oxygenase [Rhizomicrobium sp.]|nr:2OG-Fe(II) oxygenase [Rhizomicrobium sp.]HWB96829.1 2OG-Fe(II) oxygenase [Bryobacteraceae bacterium]
MNKPLLPDPSSRSPFVIWEGAFDAEMLKALAQYADSLPHKHGTVDVGNEQYDRNSRVTRVAWLERNSQTERFYDRLEEIILSLNSQFYQYDLSAIVPLQHVVYEGSDQGHLDWHIDYARESDQKGSEFRKLSLSIQLSDPSEYEGGELQAQVRGKIDVAPKTFGTVIAFSSFTLHRVTLVTAGVRKAIIVWVLGPDFH